MHNRRLTCEALEARDTPAAIDVFAVGSGPGEPPLVRAFDADTGAQLAAFAPFEATFFGGVTVAAGDINADGFGDVVVGAGPGGGPRVTVFDGQALLGGFVTPIADFFAFEDSQRGGVNVATGDFANLPGLFSADELVVGAGPGGGPRVRIFDGDRIILAAGGFTGDLAGDVVADFFPFESTFRNGVTVATGERGGIFSTLITGPGEGGSPRVRVFEGTQISTLRQLFTGVGPGDVIADFFADDPDLRTGVFVAGPDINNDSLPDVAVGAGPGGTTGIQVFDGAAIFAAPGIFTGAGPGDLLAFVNPAAPEDLVDGATVGAALGTFGGDLLITGVGQPGTPGQVFVSQFTPVGLSLTQTVLFAIPFGDGSFARPNVSN